MPDFKTFIKSFDEEPKKLNLDQAIVDNATGKAGMENFMSQAKDPHSKGQQSGYAEARFGNSLNPFRMRERNAYAKELGRYAERDKGMPKTEAQLMQERKAKEQLVQPKPTPIVNKAKTLEEVREEEKRKPKKPIHRITI